MTSTSYPCRFCAAPRPRRSTHCPHCGQPSDFPNVEDAKSPEESDALQERYNDAVSEAANRGCEGKLHEFEAAVASSSRAIFACPLTKLMPLATGLHDLYATFYRLAELRIPKGPPAPGDPNWDLIRPVIETALFGDEYKKQIHYAALTLDGRGLPSYGECFVLLRDEMIAHRASVFEENSLLFMKRHDVKIFEVDRLPAGYRATWADRGKLASAKLVARVEASMPAERFPELLMRPAANRRDDDFVEVHLFGPMSAFTFEKVTYLPKSAAKGRKRKRRRARRGDTNLKVLSEKLEEAGAKFESLA